jgi:RND family efflux transporter MFP subunit
MNKRKKPLIQFALVVAIVIVAIGAAKMMSSLRKPPEKKARNVSAPFLNAIRVHPESLQMMVQGYGTVKPQMAVQVVPQVSGRVTQCHPQFVNGGFFKANEPLVVIEQIDYTLAVESADATVAQAEVKVEQEKAEADVAHQEWEKLHPDKQPDSILVFREPQIRNAQAQLNAAKAQLAKAKLNLERTTITMPFDGRIVQASVDTGQFITAGAPIATVYRTDIVEIVVPLEDAELEWFDLSLDGNQNNASGGTPVDVSASFAGGEYTWQGKLVRTEGQIDPKSRMVHVVAQVADPFKTVSSKPPLMPGIFVRVDIQGRQVENIYRLPRYAIRRSAEVWLAAGTGETKKLTVQPVKIVRMDRDFAYVTVGLNEGDFVITSALETVTNGMAVRVLADETTEDQ